MSYYVKNGDSMEPSEQLLEAERVVDEKLKVFRDKKTSFLDTLSKSSILICSPDPSSFAKQAKRAGFMVFVARDSKEFLEIMNKMKVQNVIIDLNTPGVETLRRYTNGSTHVIVGRDGGILKNLIDDNASVLPPEALKFLGTAG